MNWITYSLVAIGIVAVSDIFRKWASTIKDPFWTNFLFQLGAISAGLLLFLLFSKNAESTSKQNAIAFVSGFLISLFSLFSFKALATGPGVSIVMPVLRIGGVALVAALGVVLLKEKFTLQTLIGLLFSSIGMYLLFTSK